ncbi:NAD-dependent epimerase/dehydratase family protein [Actinophytocola sp.]|uniref:NAD-dependent epimerase/dehydratase family protein n=1 Tax=Actinophytocola sp. TaxID=1872138 RepID=UPI003899C1DB
MRVLVTGAAGTIGGAVMRDLAARGVAVTELPGDATDERGVGAAVEGCAAVVHLAALAHPSLGTPRAVFTNNVVATFTVLAAAAEHGARRVVLASSVNASGIPMNPHGPLPAYFPLDEDLPIDIADAYSLSKQVDEHAAAMAARAWGLDVVALRFPLVKPRAELLEIAAEVAKDPAGAMRTGWSYLTVDDAARAVHAALVAPVTGAHVVGLAAADTLLAVPTQSLVDTYAPDVPCRRSFAGTEPLIDTTRARELLGFEPRESIHP